MNRLPPLLVLAMLLGTFALNAADSYRYKCPKCSGIYTYGWPGIYKCPNDGTTLNRL